MAVDRETIIKQARTWLGTKYHHQGRLKKNVEGKHQGGVDCLGLLIGIAKELGLKSKDGQLLTIFDRDNYGLAPDNYKLQEELRQHLEVVSKTEIKEGDIGLFRFSKYPQHVGLISSVILDKQTNLSLIHCYRGSGYVIEHIFRACCKIKKSSVIF